MGVVSAGLGGGDRPQCLLGCEVNHADFFNIGIEVFATERLMVRVRKISISVLRGGERYNEAVCETQIEVLRTRVSTALEPDNEREFRRETGELGLDDSDRKLTGCGTKLKQDNMPVGGLGRLHTYFLLGARGFQSNIPRVDVCVKVTALKPRLGAGLYGNA